MSPMMESSADVLNLLRGVHSPGEGPQSSCAKPGSTATGSALLGGGLACSPIPWRVRESPSQGKPEDITGRPAAACDKGVAKATSESTEQTGPRQDKNSAKEHHSRDHRISNRGIVGGGPDGELLLGPLLPEEEASLGTVTAGELGPGQQGKRAMNKSSLKGVIRGQSPWDDSVRTARYPTWQLARFRRDPNRLSSETPTTPFAHQLRGDDLQPFLWRPEAVPALAGSEGRTQTTETGPAEARGRGQKALSHQRQRWVAWEADRVVLRGARKTAASISDGKLTSARAGGGGDVESNHPGKSQRRVELPKAAVTDETGQKRGGDAFTALEPGCVKNYEDVGNFHIQAKIWFSSGVGWGAELQLLKDVHDPSKRPYLILETHGVQGQDGVLDRMTRGKQRASLVLRLLPGVPQRRAAYRRAREPAEPGGHTRPQAPRGSAAPAL
ncbi:unnamed protein product [Rangifer tarandus platyrhynchus]|uniref:Uncharacterized protein n=1 Tax=Rangifer tarandus platyrhynchus TaxID=3082113 RepID=A0ABN8ZYA7_RANTA|nr:unnamed protein product [Rangifer tarandus platyrhynchus]